MASIRDDDFFFGVTCNFSAGVKRAHENLGSLWADLDQNWWLYADWVVLWNRPKTNKIGSAVWPVEGVKIGSKLQLFQSFKFFPAKTVTYILIFLWGLVDINMLYSPKFFDGTTSKTEFLANFRKWRFLKKCDFLDFSDFFTADPHQLEFSFFTTLLAWTNLTNWQNANMNWWKLNFWRIF